MMMTRRALLAGLGVTLASGQTIRDYRTDLQHPRLLLPPRRLRLLRRERERESMRWTQFHALVAGGAEMPEPGFAYSLYWVAAGSEVYGRRAVEWALSSDGSDLRQLALVFDWCYPLLTAGDRKKIADKMSRLIAMPGAGDIAAVRSQVLAAVALTGVVEGIAEKILPAVVEGWWKGRVLDVLAKGETPFEPRDHLALMEMLHTLRDNLDIELRETAPKHFLTLPVYHLLAHYPAPYPGPENEYRIPLMKAHGEPDLREAARTRAAALAMVAYDNNSQEMQFLQGWLIQDRFLLRSPYGIPYEFLWANPYQPGLSFHYLPNVFHDPATGRLIIRSSWEDDAVWYFQAAGVMQLFRNGEIANLKQEVIQEPMNMGNTTLLPARLAAQFQVASPEDGVSRYYIVGLEPDTWYDVEVEDEEIRDVQADRGGVAELVFPPRRLARVRFQKSPPAV
jgi:hypothetical protein